MYKFKKYFNIICFKYLYFSVLVILIPIIILSNNLNIFSDFLKEENNIGSLASIAGAFIGFMLTVATVYFSMPGKSKFKQWLITKGHHKIFIRIILMGIIFFFIPIVAWLISNSDIYIYAIYFFIAGCLEVGASIYYLYYLIVKNSLS